MIKNISIEKLRPHPNNPRKDLGDLTELADSIRANGVFQNLTVVPNDDDTYTVIIGHRRTEAAKLAGLTELPCAIVDMSEKDQLGTMLLENMQRSDLTVYEQAQGFQLMLNLGETVESIHEKTGFGKSTIYKRVKLCQLDKDKFLKGQERGATLEDYAKLDKITDPELKNRALDSIGTDNFDNAIRTAVADEKYNAKLAKWETLLSSFATRLSNIDHQKYKVYKIIYMTDGYYNNFQIPDDADDVDYVYTVGVNSWDRERISIYTEYSQSSLEEAREQEEKRRKEQDRALRNEKFEELAIFYSKSRYKFIKRYTSSTNTAIGRLLKIVDCYILCTTGDSNWYGFNGYERFVKLKLVCDILDFDYSVNKDEFERAENLFEMMEYVPEFEKLIRDDAAKFMLACLFMNMETTHFGKPERYIETWTYYNESKVLTVKQEKYLSMLEDIGYQMSDEERSLYDGTHELYAVEEDEEFIDEDDILDMDDE